MFNNIDADFYVLGQLSLVLNFLLNIFLKVFQWHAPIKIACLSAIQSFYIW